jgi:hypothetical protein
LTNRDVISDKANLMATELPYANEKIFKVSKAITQHLSDVLKTNEGIFDETVEIRFLRNLRQKAEDIEKNNKNIKAHFQMLDSINQICYDAKGNHELYWVFIFAKRLASLEDDKLRVLENIDRTHQDTQQNIQNVRQTFADKSALRLTTVRDKNSTSINFDDIKSVLLAPYRQGGDTRVDTRFVDLDVKNKNKIVKRINNAGSFSKLPV